MHLFNGNYFAGRRGGDGPVAGAPAAARVALPVFLTEDGLVTDAQVRRLREKRMAGKTLAAAAAAAGMSGRAARKATKPRCCPRCSPSATSAAR